MRGAMLTIGVLAGVLVIGALLIEEGEIVSLETRGEDRVFVTQLWIVELDGTRYLRSGSSDTAWLARLRDDPDVRLRAVDAPHDELGRYHAVVVEDRALHDRVAGAMAEKYGFSDVIWSWVTDRSDSVVIELQPARSPGTEP